MCCTFTSIEGQNFGILGWTWLVSCNKLKVGLWSIDNKLLWPKNDSYYLWAPIIMASSNEQQLMQEMFHEVDEVLLMYSFPCLIWYLPFVMVFFNHQPPSFQDVTFYVITMISLFLAKYERLFQPQSSHACKGATWKGENYISASLKLPEVS